MARIIRPTRYFFSMPSKAFFVTMKLLRNVCTGQATIALERGKVFFIDASGYIVHQIVDIDCLHYPCNLPQKRFALSLPFDEICANVLDTKQKLCNDETHVQLSFSSSFFSIDFVTEKKK